MRYFKVLGIVSGYKPKNEYDRLINVFTDYFGKISATAKYAQKPTSPFVGRLNPMNVCGLNIYKSSKGKFTITQCVLIETFENIKNNIALLSIGFAILEIAEKLTYQRLGMKQYFNLIYKTLKTVNKNLKPYFIYLIFKIKFLYMLGLIPSFKRCVACNKAIDINKIQIWGIENVMCQECFKNNQDRLKDKIFEKNMLRFINFILRNNYEKNLKIKISKKEIEFLEVFLHEIWGKHDLPSINSEKLIKQMI